MTAAFPSWITVYPLQDQFAEQPEANQVAFQPEVGPATLRRRSSLSTDLVTFMANLSSSDWDDLKAFYRATINDGTLQFTMVHPRAGVAATWQWVPGSPPKVNQVVGPFTYQIVFTLRLISGGVVLPAVLSISPSSGLNTGGTAVTITGTNFNGATLVEIGGIAATSVVVVNSTTITAVTPAVASPGVVDVEVTTPRGTGIGGALYTYTAWYAAYAIGGVNPYLFADPTTEGGSNHYLYNGTTYSSFAAWLTAVSGTFSRASAKYVTNSSGLLVQLSSGVVPFDYSATSVGTPVGLLFEGASTNLLLYSNAPSSWGSNVDVTLTTPSGKAPDGSSSATTVAVSSSGSLSLPSIQQAINTSGTYTFSPYLRYNSTQYAVMWIYTGGAYKGAVFDLLNGVLGAVDSGITATIAKGPNGFYRCAIGIASTNLYVAVGPRSSNSTATTQTFAGTENFDIAFSQVEALSFASSYIPTTSSTASRAADSLSFNPSSWYSGSASTFYWAYEFDNVSLSQGLSGASSGNEIYVVKQGTGSIEYFTDASGGFDTNGSHTNYSTGVTHKTALSYQSGAWLAYFDGNQDLSNTATAYPNPATIYLGSAGGSSPMFGHMQQYGYYQVKATGAELGILT